MGKIKEKLYDLAELVYQVMDAGATDQEIDEYVQSQISPEEYEFYHAHKDIIADMIPYLGESLDEIFMPRLNEDSFDEQEFLEDEEAPQSYEDWLDDVFLQMYTILDNDADEDYCKELFVKYEDELRDIFDEPGANAYEAAQLVIRNDEEENADEYGKWCNDCGSEFEDGVCPQCGENQEDEDDDFDEDQMREDMYDPQDDPSGRNLITGEMDESYMMESLDEGCNCGGRRPRPLLPSVRRPGVRRPVNTPKRPSWIRGTKKLHEKYTEVSDPIKDMGIGIDPKRIAKKFLKAMNGNITKTAMMYFGGGMFQGHAEVLYGFFQRIEKGENIQNAFYNSCENENFHGNREDIVKDRILIADVIKKRFYLEVNPNDPRFRG